MGILDCSLLSSHSIPTRDSLCKPIVPAPAIDTANRAQREQSQQTIKRMRFGGSEILSNCSEDILDASRATAGHCQAKSDLRYPLLTPFRFLLGRAFIFCAGMRIQPREKSTNAPSGHRHARIGCSVIEMNGVSILSDGLSARKDDISNISRPLIVGFGAKHPGISSLQADIRPIDIEESESQAIDAARRRLPHAVIKHQPALCCFNRWRAKTDLVCVPPSAAARLEHYLMVAPML